MQIAIRLTAAALTLRNLPVMPRSQANGVPARRWSGMRLSRTSAGACARRAMQIRDRDSIPAVGYRPSHRGTEDSEICYSVISVSRWLIVFQQRNRVGVFGRRHRLQECIDV